MEEVVGDAALLVAPGDVAALAGALDMLVRGDARLGGRRERGIAIAAAYTWEACAERHMAVHRSLVDGIGDAIADGSARPTWRQRVARLRKGDSARGDQRDRRPVEPGR
jgi:hypothetical protein